MAEGMALALEKKDQVKMHSVSLIIEFWFVHTEYFYPSPAGVDGENGQFRESKLHFLVKHVEQI